jgi:hypothetical protein
MYRLVATLLLLLMPTVGASAQGLPVPSQWKDRQGSEMSLFTINAKGAFTGKLVNHAAGFACENAPYDLHGQAHGHHVRFSVMWKNGAQDCKSHTSWYGRVTGKTITTWWVLTYFDKHGAVKKMRGADTFVEQP